MISATSMSRVHRSARPFNFFLFHIHLIFALIRSTSSYSENPAVPKKTQKLQPLFPMVGAMATSSAKSEAPAVSFIQNHRIAEVVLIGGKSAGKSTLVEALLGFRFNLVKDPSAAEPSADSRCLPMAGKRTWNRHLSSAAEGFCATQCSDASSPRVSYTFPHRYHYP